MLGIQVSASAVEGVHVLGIAWVTQMPGIERQVVLVPVVIENLQVTIADQAGRDGEVVRFVAGDVVDRPFTPCELGLVRPTVDGEGEKPEDRDASRRKWAVDRKEDAS